MVCSSPAATIVEERSKLLWPSKFPIPSKHFRETLMQHLANKQQINKKLCTQLFTVIYEETSRYKCGRSALYNMILMPWKWESMVMFHTFSVITMHFILNMHIYENISLSCFNRYNFSIQCTWMQRTSITPFLPFNIMQHIILCWDWLDIVSTLCLYN